ncbi:LysE family translocator [Martelella mangrovi]|uniref:Threonine/homoserine/homoserine lactone efflux protein n=1 Tax=Martelella mangrovi TaxID=1397477 RepID=A0ABV2I6R5_9HYPH
MTDLASLLPIALAFLIVAVSPGPANIATATLAMRSGRRVAMVFGTGLAVGLSFWGVVAATGMGALLQGSVYFLTGLKILGGAYLLYLAVQSARTAVHGKVAVERFAGTGGHWFRRGLLLNLSNPKAVLAWMAVLSVGAEGGGHNMMTATLVCMLIGLANYMFYALAFSLSGVMAGYRRFSRAIEGAVAGLFATAGYGLLRSAVSR